MSKGRRIVPGDTVEILAIHRESAWFGDRKELIGKKVEIDYYEPAGPSQGYAAIGMPPNVCDIGFIYGAKVRRVEEKTDGTKC